MKRIICVLCAISLALVLLTGCGSSPKKTLRVGVMPDLNCVPMSVAEQQGFLGANVELVLFRSAQERESALMSGAIDGCSSDMLAVCFAENAGQRLLMTSVTNGDYAIVASQEMDADSLVGMKLAVSTSTIIEYVADSIIEELGGDPASSETINVPKLPSRLELLATGEVDAIGVPEPFATEAENSGGVVLGRASELDILPSILCFSEQAVTEKAALIKAFAKAYDQAVAYMAETDRGDYLPAAVEALGLPDAANSVRLPDYRTTTLPERAQLERVERWLRGKALIDCEIVYEDLVWNGN